MALLCFALTLGTAGAAAAAPNCPAFISALKGADPGNKMDKSGEKMFTKICMRNPDPAVNTAISCLESGKGGGNATLDKCLKPLK
jgi:hypothetical protein